MKHFYSYSKRIVAAFCLFLSIVVNGFAATPFWTYDGPTIFDGSTTYIDGGTSPGSATSLTVSFKMKANKLAYMVPIDKFPTTGSAGWGIKLRTNGDIWFNVGGGTSSSSNNVSATGAYSVGTPVHIACTYTGGVANLYVIPNVFIL